MGIYKLRKGARIIMANLVDVLFDKDTGKVKLGTVLGGGNMVPAGLDCAYGYIFQQLTPATTWTITHNAATNVVLSNVIDAATNELVYPDSVIIIDSNTIQINFTTAMAGLANIVVIQVC